jgi:hypothetical protein
VVALLVPLLLEPFLYEIFPERMSSIPPSTLLLAGLFASIGCYRLFAASSRGEESETIHDEYKSDSGPTNDTDNQPLSTQRNNTAPRPLPRFAWEAAPFASNDKSSAAPPVVSQQNKSMPERLITARHITGSSQDSEKSLEFLAGMTFANGGLRAPSCPCCI